MLGSAEVRPAVEDERHIAAHPEEDSRLVHLGEGNRLDHLDRLVEGIRLDFVEVPTVQ